MLKIKYKISYDAPKCVLISPFYMHCAEMGDQVINFENKTNTKVLVYRTFCHTTAVEVIENADITDQHKKILNSINQGGKLVTNNGKSYIDTSAVKLTYQGYCTGDLLHTRTGSKIYARVLPNL